jgi:hypothetical protein
MTCREDRQTLIAAIAEACAAGAGLASVKRYGAVGDGQQRLVGVGAAAFDVIFTGFSE